jgi:nitroreductase
MIDAIQNRRSVRTYQKKQLNESDEKHVISLIKEINQMKGPFGHKIKLAYHPNAYVDNDAPIKIGTYGFVKHAPAFISGVVTHNFKGLIDFGYLFEYLILRLTELNLGTVWLAGTFNRKAFKQLIEQEEIIPAITPVGYENEEQSTIEKIIRRRSKGDDRNPFESMFFVEDFKTTLTYGENRVSHVLELLRVAPSASNKQPWRILLKDDAFHLYLARTPNYAKILNFDIQALDMGIALCHLTLGLGQDISTPHIETKHVEVETSFDYIATIKDVL